MWWISLGQLGSLLQLPVSENITRHMLASSVRMDKCKAEDGARQRMAKPIPAVTLSHIPMDTNSLTFT